MSFITVPSNNPSSALSPVYELEPQPAMPRRRQLQNTLYRGRWLWLALAAAGLVAGAAASWLIRPYYVADGSIIIQQPSLRPAELTPEGYQPPVDADRELQTELTVLASRAVAAPVIEQLNLAQRDPEIRAALAAAERSASRRGRSFDGAHRQAVVDRSFAAKLKLVPDKLSNTVHLEYGSIDPQLAAAVVNATTASFFNHTLKARGQQGDSASAWMRKQLDAATRQLAADDQAVSTFQQQHVYTPLLEANGAQSGLLNRLADANHAWAAAQAESLSDEAAVRSYAGGVVAALPADLRNPGIDRAAENVSSAKQQVATLEATYQPNFPLVVEAQAQLAAAERQLADLRSQVSAGLEQRLNSSRQRAAELGQLVANLNQQAATRSGLEMQFQVVKQRADAQRSLVDTLRQKLAEVEMQASLPPSNLQVLDAAAAPTEPAYPKLPLDLGLGLGVGLVLGLGTVLVREHWSETLTAGTVVKQRLGPALAPLGMIPEQRRSRRGTQALLPAAAGGDADQGAYAKIAANLVARCGAPPRAILVTSANSGDGKTTSVCRLGLALAERGWRTLLVDADLRRPGCHAFFGLANASGLLAAQSGRKVPPLPVSPHLDLMPCESDAGQALHTRAVAALLEQWREHYDYILIDSAPGNLTGEAVLLSSLVEGVLVVLRWGRTRLPEAEQLCEELARARAPLLGTLFNRADPGAPIYRSSQPAA